MTPALRRSSCRPDHGNAKGKVFMTRPHTLGTAVDITPVIRNVGAVTSSPLGLATAGPLVGTGLTGRKAARTLKSLCFAGSAPGPSRSLPCALLWRAWGRTPSEHQPTPTPVWTRPRMSSTTRRHTGSAVPGRPPRRPSRSVWSANGPARGGHPLSASLTMRLPSTRYGGRSLTASGPCRGRGPHSPRFAGRPL